jgi:amino acid transporter
MIVGVATWAKFLALAVLVLSAFTLGAGHGGAVANLTTATGAPLSVGSMGLALVSILWAYDGWADLSFASGEVKDPGRNLPRAIILGTIAIIVLYVATNVAYLYVNPIEKVAQSRLVAADTMLALFGRVGVVLVSIFVMISSFSSLNGSMLASPRVFFAMADDGLFFQTIAKVHPRFKTPYIAIILAALLGMALVLSRSFEALTDTFVLAIWPFYALGVAAIYRLRRSRPELARPYRAIGYPIVPAIFIVAVIAFVVNALINEPVPTSITFALIFAGAPVYWFVFSARRVTR